jgi:hypothetical protein
MKYEATGVNAANNKFLTNQKEALDVFSNKKKNKKKKNKRKEKTIEKKRWTGARLTLYLFGRKTASVHIQSSAKRKR